MNRQASVLLVIACSLLQNPLNLHAQSTAAPHAKSTGRASAQELDKLLRERWYPQLLRDLPGAILNSDERTYFEGMVADRTHRVSEAIALLEKVLPELEKNNPHHAALAISALASDYFETGRYKDSADAYALILKNYRSEFTPAELQGSRDNLHTFELLRDAPPQSVSGDRRFTVPTRQDPIGDLDVPVKVGGTEMWWIFDTGANVSTVSLSTAKRLGLKLSEGQASTQAGVTGTEVPLRTAVIPELRFGEAIIHNAVVLVAEDKQLDIDAGKNGRYAIQGILGYPVLAALGSFTFSGGQVAVEPTGAPSADCAPMFVESLTPLVAAGVDRKELLFSFDSGAYDSILTAKYLHSFPQQFTSLKVTKIGSAEAGGVRMMAGYRLPSVELHLGSASTTLHDVSVLKQRAGTGLIDSLYGNLGRSILAPFSSYTIDFSRMQMCVDAKAK